MTVVVTGGNGFLASYIIKIFLEEGINVISLVRSLKSIDRLKGLEEKIQIIESSSDLERIFSASKVDAIVHTATVYGRSNINYPSLLETNVLLPIKLASLGCQYGVKYFINTDTYFNTNEMEYQFLGEYVLSKRQCVEWLKNISTDIRVLNLKLEHLYGPGDNQNKFVPSIIGDLQSKEKVDLTPGEQKRDFVFVTDVAHAYLVALRSLKKISSNFTTIEVGSGFSTSIKEFIQLAHQQIDSKSELNFGGLPYRNNEIMDSKADITFLQSLGWHPKIPLSEGLKRTIRT